MSFQNLGIGERFVPCISELLSEAGVTLSLGENLEEFGYLVRNGRENHSIASAFDADFDDLGEPNVLWIVGHDRFGKLVHAQALRLFDLGETALSSYLSANFCHFGPGGAEIDGTRSTYRPGPGSTHLSGKVAYHGEFWINAGLNRFGGAVLSSVLCRYGFWEAFQKWSPDAIFCFMANSVACKGFAARGGWTHMEPGAVRLGVVGKDEPVEGFLGYVLPQDLDYVLDSVVPAANQPRVAA